MFTAEGIDLSGWNELRVLHRSLYSKPGLDRLTATIDYDRQTPLDSKGKLDVTVGTGVMWSLEDDDLDHHYEVRRFERRAATLRDLIPASIDTDGWSEADCWIKINPEGVSAYASKDNGTESDSTLSILMMRTEDGWKDLIELSTAWARPLIEIIAMSGEDMMEVVAECGWDIGSSIATSARHEDGSIILTIEDADNST